ncbi:MAG: transposase, partial [Coriobacteriia bacterium]|nr:transposase [Coriobacteriia bacterium]
CRQLAGLGWCRFRPACQSVTYAARERVTWDGDMGTGRLSHSATILATGSAITLDGNNMSRQARQLSESGIYHIMFRGVNRCNLFEEEADFLKLIDLLMCVKAELRFEVLAYCMLDNHVHLLLRESTPGDITKIMIKLLSPYAYWFNKKYGRSGALIANRYRSEVVLSDEYLLVIRQFLPMRESRIIPAGFR